MRLHREGFAIILASAIGTIILSVLLSVYILPKSALVYWPIQLVLIALFVLIVQFFRIPKRNSAYTTGEIICPADGKVVVIEEVEENEYFKDKRIQVSIFMSPLNVHANYYPMDGKVEYVKYHKGKFLVAWHPKSSEENERSTFVVQHENGQKVLFRQIAGALARRICYYANEGDKVKATEEFGFIKFGSRIDLFLPLNAKIDVKIGDKVKAKISKIGHFV